MDFKDPPITPSNPGGGRENKPGNEDTQMVMSYREIRAKSGSSYTKLVRPGGGGAPARVMPFRSEDAGDRIPKESVGLVDSHACRERVASPWHDEKLRPRDFPRSSPSCDFNFGSTSVTPVRTVFTKRIGVCEGYQENLDYNTTFYDGLGRESGKTVKKETLRVEIGMRRW